jgi:hypothetical protein
MDPAANTPNFAQCGSCRFWMPEAKLCALFVPEPEVTAEATCGLYVYGRPGDNQPRRPSVWPRDAGLETREVRCENCFHFRPDNQGCHLFFTLNEQLPELFQLNTQVHPRGCCNANTPSR